MPQETSRAVNRRQESRDKIRGTQAATRQIQSNTQKARATKKREASGAVGSRESASKAAVQQSMKKTDLGALGRAAKARRAERKERKGSTRKSSTTTTTTRPVNRSMRR